MIGLAACGNTESNAEKSQQFTRLMNAAKRNDDSLAHLYIRFPKLVIIFHMHSPSKNYYPNYWDKVNILNHI